MSTKLTFQKKTQSVAITLESPFEPEDLQKAHAALCEGWDDLSSVTLSITSIDTLPLVDIQWLVSVILTCKSQSKTIILDDACSEQIQALRIKTGIDLDQIRTA